MENTAFKIGQLVIAKAGRDKGRPLVIVEVVSCDYVRVADGDLRRIEKPKLKKVIHCAATKHHVSEWLPSQVPAEWTNAALKKALKDFTFRTE